MTPRRGPRRATTLAGMAIVGALALSALLAPWLAPGDPGLIDPAGAFAGSSAAHWLGTDNLGRDVLGRLLLGGRWSLGIAAIATALVMTIGVSVGLVAGYAGGLVDDVLMRLVDALLSVPTLLLALAIVGTLGPGIASLTIGLAGIWWVNTARVVRGMVCSLRERGHVQAARALGASDARIMRRHILPGILPMLAVLSALEMGELILAISGLSFLGLGAQPPAAEWGAMLNDARTYFFVEPRLVLYPGLAVTGAVAGFTLLGDGLRDALDRQHDAMPGRTR